MSAAQVVFPHQLFVEHLDADPATVMVLVEPDLFFRQFAFHVHKLVLHRATMKAFQDRLRRAGFATAYVETSGEVTSDEQLVEVLREHRVDEVTVFDVVDDWLERDLRRACRAAGAALTVAETPGFLTSREEVAAAFDGVRQPRMQHFYERQRRRLDLLMDGDRPVGGRWSYDTENRRRLPRDIELPALPQSTRSEHVKEAVTWCERAFPDNPGDLATYHWPTTHRQAETWLNRFLEDRFALFGPYEDAIAADEPWLFHSALSPLLNIGLLDPRHVVERAVAHATEHEVDLPSLEGFVRQVIGWREYVWGMYWLRHAQWPERNALRAQHPLPPAYRGEPTGWNCLDSTVQGVRETGYAHHIERLMVLGTIGLTAGVEP